MVVLNRIQTQYQKVKAFYNKYESLFMPALIVWGFVFHYITFKVIPITELLYLVFGYLGLATLVIIFIHLYDQDLITRKLRYFRLFAPLILQFSLGSIIGGVFIFYWFAGSILVSWPFIVLLILLVVSLELYKHYLENPTVQFALYNFSAFLILAVALPYFFTSINPVLFIISGLISLGLVFFVIWILKKSVTIGDYKNKIIIVSVLVFVVMNVFYFYNLIPPVPLSIRDSGVFHNVYQSGRTFVAEFEPETFWESLSLTPTVHLGPGERVYVFTAIYSPTDLDTDIIYEWQYYDPVQKEWASREKTSLHVVGGRQEGYRSYSYKTNTSSGKWRVYIKTPRGQVLGLIKFNIERVAQTPPLEEEAK